MRPVAGDASIYPLALAVAFTLALATIFLTSSRPKAHIVSAARYLRRRVGGRRQWLSRRPGTLRSSSRQIRLEPGDVLICEGNSAELVGRPAIWNGEIEGCVHQNHVLRVRTNRESLLPEFLLAYMHTPAARLHFRRRAKRTTNLATISGTDVKDLQVPVPVPPLPEQVRIAGIWASAVDARGRFQEEAAHIRKETREAVEAAIVGGVAIPPT